MPCSTRTCSPRSLFKKDFPIRAEQILFYGATDVYSVTKSCVFIVVEHFALPRLRFKTSFVSILMDLTLHILVVNFPLVLENAFLMETVISESPQDRHLFAANAIYHCDDVALGSYTIPFLNQISYL